MISKDEAMNGNRKKLNAIEKVKKNVQHVNMVNNFGQK